VKPLLQPLLLVPNTCTLRRTRSCNHTIFYFCFFMQKLATISLIECVWNKDKRKKMIRLEELLILIVGMVPIIPTTMCNNVIEVCVGIDDSGILSHCSSHIQWTCTCHPASHECEPCLLFLLLPVLGRYRPKPACYWVQPAILIHQPFNFLIRPIPKPNHVYSLSQFTYYFHGSI